MAKKYLLLQDVEGLGRSGQLVEGVKPGYMRNFLIPRGFAVPAHAANLRLQERLNAERLKKAAADRSESEKNATLIEGTTLTTVVKVDHDGHMYGSVSTSDIVDLLQKSTGFEIEKKSIQLAHPIKKTGVQVIRLKLKEGVEASFNLKVMSEEEHRKASEESDAAGVGA